MSSCCGACGGQDTEEKKTEQPSLEKSQDQDKKAEQSTQPEEWTPS